MLPLTEGYTYDMHLEMEFVSGSSVEEEAPNRVSVF